MERFGAEVGGSLWDQFTVHYTPVHGSWLNQAELEIGLFSRQCLGSAESEIFGFEQKLAPGTGE